MTAQWGTCVSHQIICCLQAVQIYAKPCETGNIAQRIPPNGQTLNLSLVAFDMKWQKNPRLVTNFQTRTCATNTTQNSLACVQFWIPMDSRIGFLLVAVPVAKATLQGLCRNSQGPISIEGKTRGPGTEDKTYINTFVMFLVLCNALQCFLLLKAFHSFPYQAS